MDKLKMHTPNRADDNFAKLSALFPSAVTETINENGELVRAIDKDVLMQEISATVVDGREERYQFTWPDKKKSVLTANAPINKTLRPCREESVSFDTTENLYIEGDNLEVLKLLQETYLGKVKVVYIDPPYNTGNDILYKNDYSQDGDEYTNDYERDDEGNLVFQNTSANGRFHTDWLNMLYQRIKIAKDLISNDGFFIVSIDHNELFNLGVICDEIFGYSNRIGVISVIHKPEGRNQAKFIGPSNEFLIVYAKNEGIAKLQNVVLNPEVAKKYNLSDNKGNYRLQNFIRLTDGKLAHRSVRPKFWYPIYADTATGKLFLESNNANKDNVAVYPKTKVGVEMSWKVLPETTQKLIDNGELEISRDNDGFISIMEKLRETQVIKTHWDRKEYNFIQYGTKIANNLLGANIFDFPKSLYLMHDIYKLFADKNDIVLDFFSGSATSAHAVMQLNAEDNGNRKFVLVQIPASCDEKSEAYKAGYKNICEIGKERIRKAGQKIKTELDENSSQLILGEEPKKSPDIGFRVLKCDSSNMKDVYYYPEETEVNMFDNLVSNIKEDRTAEDLLMQVMLDLGVLLSSKIESYEINGKKIFSVADDYLIACFDDDVTDEIVEQIAKKKPYYFVMRDSSLADSSVAVNFEQLFMAYSADTIRMVL